MEGNGEGGGQAGAGRGGGGAGRDRAGLDDEQVEVGRAHADRVERAKRTPSPPALFFVAQWPMSTAWSEPNLPLPDPPSSFVAQWPVRTY